VLVVAGACAAIALVVAALYVTSRSSQTNQAFAIGKIVLSMIQILCASQAAFQLTFPAGFATLINFLLVFTLDIFGFLRLGCVSSYSYTEKLAAAYALPAALSLSVMGVYLYRRGAEDAAEVRTKMGFAALFLVFPFVSQTMFEAFVCRDIGGQTFLAIDYQVPCDNSDYTALVAVAIVGVFLYPLAVPVLTLVILFKHRKAIYNEEPTVCRTYSFVLADYKKRHYYWDVVEMLRKVCLTGIICVVQRGSLLQLVLGAVLSLISLAASAWCQPYKSRAANAFKLATETSILITLILCMLLKYPADILHAEGLDENFVGVCMLIQTICLPAMVLVLSTAYLGYEVKAGTRDIFEEEPDARNEETDHEVKNPLEGGSTPSNAGTE
jgi:hypothetical protein